MRRFVAGLGALAVLVAGCGEAPEPADPPSPTGVPFGPGADGLDDPYFPAYGNGGYQVDHYHLAVTYDPASKELTGQATIEATATQPLSQLSLDLSGLEVREVTVDGAPAEVAHEDEKLVVAPAAGLPEGGGFTVTVAYDGVPEPVNSPGLGSDGFHHVDGGVVAMGEPRSASTWFPVNDHPLDKATYTIEITVPEGLAAISNGALTGSDPDDGWTTWAWEETFPMASYLAMVVIGDYRVHETTHDDGRPVVVAVHEDLPVSVDDQLARTPELADLLSQWFGPYPFGAYGGVALADDQFRYALETQSRPVYGPVFFEDGRDASWVIVHELAHQWFGNSVSLTRWDDIWLNEGFATYAEWLWSEETGGDTAADIADFYLTGPGAAEDLWDVPPGDPGGGQLFHGAVYVRGALTLHALREEVGDDAFFSILVAWADTYRYRNATTDDFTALSERISDQDLDDLFDEWLYTAGQPASP